MTLYDLELPFTLNFHCYEVPFQNLCYILTVPVYRTFLLYHDNSWDVRKRTDVVRRIFGICGKTADLSYRRKVAGAISSDPNKYGRYYILLLSPLLPFH